MLVSMALFMLMLLIMSIQVTIHGYNIGKHKTGGWNVCFISMRGDKFKKYIKRHDWKKEDNIITKGLDDAKYNSQKLKLKKHNVLMVFSNMELDENTLSKDRWIILKISNDFTELTDIVGRKIEKWKDEIKDFAAGEVKSEKENIDSDGSGKRKSSELPMYNKVRVIETNPELNDGRAEAEKEKNTKQENQEIYEKGYENEEIYEKRHENDSHKVEHKRENIDSDGSGRENQVKSK